MEKKGGGEEMKWEGRKNLKVRGGRHAGGGRKGKGREEGEEKKGGEGEKREHEEESEEVRKEMTEGDDRR